MKKLIWESSFFNQSCGELDKFNGDFDAKVASTYDWLQSKISIDSEGKIHFLEKNGFLFEDLKLTFDKTLTDNEAQNINKDFIVKEGTNSDIEQVQKISKSVLPEKSRFVSVVGKDRTADFYAEWSAKSIAHDFDDICYVAVTQDDQAVGFITLKYMDASSAQIGLLAVSADFQKRSIASMMLSYCERLLVAKGIINLSVATEGKNIAAQRFYIKNKFNIRKIECWFYKK